MEIIGFIAGAIVFGFLFLLLPIKIWLWQEDDHQRIEKMLTEILDHLKKKGE